MYGRKNIVLMNYSNQFGVQLIVAASLLYSYNNIV